MPRAPKDRRRYRRHDHIELAAVELWGDATASPPDRMRAITEAIGDPEPTWTEQRHDPASFRLEITPQGSKPPTDTRVASTTPFVRSIDFGPSLLVARVGPPYPEGGWDAGVGDFFHRCAASFMSRFRPALVRRMGLRYRNVFQGLTPAEVPQLFSLRVVGEGAGNDWLASQRASSFGVQLVLVRGARRDRHLALRFGVEPTLEGGSKAVLDLDWYTAASGLADEAAARDFLEEGHATIHEAFEAVITDELRERLDRP